jgi:hypothetical protein
MATEPPVQTAPLQFDTAVPAGAPPRSCGGCKTPIGETYYTAGKAVVCPTCKQMIENATPGRATAQQIGRAILFGLGGAVIGALIYYGVLAATGYEIGLVAIASAFIVGRAVQRGARGARGRAFQIIAVALSYLAIAVGYAPALFKAAAERTKPAHGAAATDSSAHLDSASDGTPRRDQAPTAVTEPKDESKGGALVSLVTLVGIVLAFPVLATFGNMPVSLLTGVIIGVGLRQAWIMNRQADRPVFHGPFRVGATAAT